MNRLSKFKNTKKLSKGRNARNVFFKKRKKLSVKQKAVLRAKIRSTFEIVLIILIIIVIRIFAFESFKVNGSSMCESFNVINGKCLSSEVSKGEYLIVNKLAYRWGSPLRGDVVVFQLEDSTRYIKRIIGIGGDTIKIENGYVYLTPKDGKEIKLDEHTYLSEDTFGNTTFLNDDDRVFEVPEGEFFVMGDNRKNSIDSRICFLKDKFGCMFSAHTPYVLREEIIGRVDLVFFPLQLTRFIERIDYDLEEGL